MTDVLPRFRPVSVHAQNALPAKLPELVAVIVDPGDIKDGKVECKGLQALDAKLGGTIAAMAAMGDFEGGWLETSSSLLLDRSQGKVRVLLLGSGKKDNARPNRARQFGIKVAEEASRLKANTALVVSSSRLLKQAADFRQCAFGLHLGAYKYPASNASDEVKKQLETPFEVALSAAGGFDAETAKAVDAELKEVELLARSTLLCRQLQDGPPNVVHPGAISKVFLEKAKAAGLHIEVMGAQKLKEKGMGALLAVGGGSSHEPQLITIEYKPKGYSKTLALVGKGLTMDTGGYSIKTPSASQVKMKYDMSGSAIVLSSILAIAELKLPVRVVAVAAVCENMVDAHAYRVGDVLTTYAGKTIEVMNTDAEGRIVLADALAYATKDLAADYVVEFSTLTGAMIVALGSVGAGVFSFNDDAFGKLVLEAGEKTGETMWPLPTWEEIRDDIKGQVSDLTNIGATAGSAGSIVAAVFLNEFVNGKPFVHVDIAGVANDNANIGYPRKLSAGYGLQLCVEIARRVSAAK